MMKTKYFREVALSDSGKQDLKALVAMPQKATGELLKWLSDQETYPRFDRLDRGHVASLTGESGETVASALGILKLFIDRLISTGDDISAFFEDIKTQNLLDDESDYANLDIVFSELPSIIDKYTLFSRQRITEGLGAAELAHSSLSAAIKPVYKRPFKSAEDRVETYEPNPIGTCVVAQIELESDDRKCFSFQMNPDNFNRFICDLLALQAEMKSMQEKCGRLL